MNKIVLVTMVKNEADIIESFVRHSLTFADEIIIANHMSTDRTGEILASLLSEGLPLTIRELHEVELAHGLVMTELMWEAIEEHGADIVLPAQGIDIRTWAKGLTAERWSQMVPTYSEEVELTIPKFSLNYERELKKDLQALGMTDAFDAEWKANFTRMVEPNLGGLYVWLDMVKQKAFMQVDEEGTEAAAVTVGLMKCFATAAGHQFIADRPYLFVIREKDYGTILFAAIIGHPEWQK